VFRSLQARRARREIKEFENESMSPGVARTAYRGEQHGTSVVVPSRSSSFPAATAENNNELHPNRQALTGSGRIREQKAGAPGLRTPASATPPSLLQDRLADRWQTPATSIGSETVKVVELSTEVRELGSQRDSLIEVIASPRMAPTRPHFC